METSIQSAQNEQHEIRFLDFQLPAPQARQLMLSFLNSRIEYHNQELFGEMERNGSMRKEHAAALEQLANIRKDADYLLLKAMTKHLNITIQGHLNITMTHANTGEKQV